MLGGKTPHIQNVAVGGVGNAIKLESEAALNVDRLFQMKSLLAMHIGDRFGRVASGVGRDAREK
jgi:Ni,Fe-hydrogenase I large subunit